MSGRHLAPKPRGGHVRALGALGAAIAVAALTSGSAATPTGAAFTDKARAAVAATSYTVPAPATTAVQVSGTGEYISSRIQASCDAPSGMAWRWRDHMVAWGETWNAWSPWSTAQSDPGWSAWSTSDLIWPNLPAEVQWEVRCGIETWTSTASLHGPVGIVRTT